MGLLNGDIILACSNLTVEVKARVSNLIDITRLHTPHLDEALCTILNGIEPTSISSLQTCKTVGIAICQTGDGSWYWAQEFGY